MIRAQRKRWSLGVKLVTGGILLVVLPLACVGIYAVTKASSGVRGVAEQQALTLAKDMTNMVSMVLGEEKKVAGLFAARPDFQETVVAVSQTPTSDRGRPVSRDVSVIPSYQAQPGYACSKPPTDRRPGWSTRATDSSPRTPSSPHGSREPD